MKLTLWRLLMMYSFTYLQVTADDQVILSDVTNTSEWFGWSEDNSLSGVYWTLCNDFILLNTTTAGNETEEQQYSLLSPVYMIHDNCNISISYTRQAEIIVEVTAISSDDDNITIANLSGTIGEVQVVTLAVDIGQSMAQIIISVTTNLNEELLTIDSVNLSDCSDVVTPTPSSLLISSTNIYTVFTSPDGLTVTRMLPFSSSQFNVPASPTITAASELLLTFTTTTVNDTITPNFSYTSTSPLSVLSTTTMTIDIVSVTLSLLGSTSSPVNSSTAEGITSDSTASAILSTTTLIPSNIVTLSITSSLTSATASVTMITVQSSSIQSLNTSLITPSTSSLSSSNSDITLALSTSIQPVNSTNLMITETSLVIVSTTDMSLSPTTVIPSSSNASNSTSSNFFSTNVIIGIAAGGGTLLLLLLCFLVCCLYRICFSQRNQQQKYLISDTSGHKNSRKGHSSVFAQDRYRHKSRSVESMNGPYQYELPLNSVHFENPPEAYVHNGGDEDTIDSESEDIRRDLRGTPTSSHPESQSAAGDHETMMTSYYPHTADMSDHHHWSDYSSDNNDDDETSSDIVYPNKSLVNDMCTGELPPILSLGDYEDDENVVIINPYNHPTFYSESGHIPNKDASPRRSGTTKGTINLEALTTLESSGEYTPKPTVPNYRRKQSRYAAGKNHKLLRKTKSEVNLEDATKISGGTRYPKHQSKSRIDLKEATKLAGHSGAANYHHRKPHHSSTPRILDSSSKLERLTSLDTY